MVIAVVVVLLLCDIGSPPKLQELLPNSYFSPGNFLCLGSLENFDSLVLTPGWRYKFLFQKMDSWPNTALQASL